MYDNYCLFVGWGDDELKGKDGKPYPCNEVNYHGKPSLDDYDNYYQSAKEKDRYNFYVNEFK